MGTSVTRVKNSSAQAVEFTEHMLQVVLKDGRTISVPLSWYPRLLHGTSTERKNWYIIGQGEGIHWPGLDEDISVSGLLEGTPSQEARESLREWLQRRKAPRRR